jgi:transcriptional regulator GlxA family with amidase domain
MTTIVADPALRSRLNGLDRHLEIRDENGQPVGHFLPQSLYEDLFYGALAAESGISMDNLKRMHQETGGRTLAEFWKDLGVA